MYAQATEIGIQSDFSSLQFKGNKTWFKQLDTSRNQEQIFSVRLRGRKPFSVYVIGRFEKKIVREIRPIPLNYHLKEKHHLKT